MGLLGDGGKDKDEGAMDRAKGRMKEAAGAMTGDKETKNKGRADQRRGTPGGWSMRPRPHRRGLTRESDRVCSS